MRGFLFSPPLTTLDSPWKIACFYCFCCLVVQILAPNFIVSSFEFTWHLELFFSPWYTHACSVISDSLWPHDCNTTSSSVHGNFQERILVLRVLSCLSYLTLCDPLDLEPARVPVPIGFSRQEQLLEWAVTSYSRGSSVHLLHWQAVLYYCATW